MRPLPLMRSFQVRLTRAEHEETPVFFKASAADFSRIAHTIDVALRDPTNQLSEDERFELRRIRSNIRYVQTNVPGGTMPHFIGILPATDTQKESL